MKPKEYIESGALEAYVLGLATPDEAAMAERMRADYPEVEEEYQAILATMDTWVQGYAKPAPANAWDAIAGKIRELGEDDKEEAATPVKPLFDDETLKKYGIDPAAENGGGRIVDINTPAQARNHRMWQGIAAGLALLAAGSLALNYSLLNVQSDLKAELAQAQQQNTVLATTASTAKHTRETLDQVLAQASDPDVQKVVMMGLKDAPKAKVMVMWKKKGHTMTMAMQGMPAMPTDKDLQLWAIVNGKPVDLGVIPMKEGELMQHDIPEVPNASAFAITLEDKGGHPQPQGTMLTMGEVKG